MGDLPQIFGSLAVGFFTILVIITFLIFLFVPGKNWTIFTSQLKNNLKQKGSLHLSLLLMHLLDIEMQSLYIMYVSSDTMFRWSNSVTKYPEWQGSDFPPEELEA